MKAKPIKKSPTEGDCYESSFKGALSLYQLKLSVEAGTGTEDEMRQYKELNLDKELFIVHGYATSPGGPHAGMRIHHAWIEIGDVVLETQGGTFQPWTRWAYYGTFSIYPNELYTVPDAMAYVTGTSGVREDYRAWRGVGNDICPHRNPGSRD